jgi:hypothetical protein
MAILRSMPAHMKSAVTPRWRRSLTFQATGTMTRPTETSVRFSRPKPRPRQVLPSYSAAHAALAEDPEAVDRSPLRRA